MLRHVLALRLRSGAYAFRESLFLLPTLIVLGGAVVAEVAWAVDRAMPPGTVLPASWSMSTNAATWLLSVVSGATITTAGVVFSLTVVSLQLASSQFSPRVMRSFIRDRLSQWVVGLLVATFVYCVLVLRHLSGEAADPAPLLSMAVAVVLSVGTVLLIIAHLDHLARRLQVGEVVRAIAEEARHVTAAVVARTATERPLEGRAGPPGEDVHVIRALRDGWVTQAGSADLLAAVPPGTTVRLDTRTGAYIHEGEALATLWPAPGRPEAVARQLGGVVTVSDTRTMQEDVDFAVRQLVDIGLRALSPAINDPTTAVEVVLRLGSLLRRLLVADLPPDAVAGPGGRVLLRPWELTHEEYVDHAFGQLRQVAPPQPHVAATLLRVLRMLVVHVQDAGRPDLAEPLRRQIGLLLEALDTVPGLLPADQDHLRAVAGATSDPGDHSSRLMRRATTPAPERS